MATFKNKHVSDDKFEEYRNMTEEELVTRLKSQHAYLEEVEHKKKSSDLLKEMRSEINEYRKTWAKQNPEQVAEIERLKEEIKSIENERDAKIDQDLEEKKDLEASFRESIAGAKEHISALVFCLRFHQ
jgi:hypothetical protein